MPRDIKDWVAKQSLANFSGTDTVVGKTFIRYYGGKTYGGDYVLATDAFYCNATYTQVAVNNVETINFDITANSTMVVDGVGILSCETHKVNESSPSSSMIISGSIIRVRGASTEIIGPEVRIGALPVSTDADTAARHTQDIAITKTRFKKGDILRLQIKMGVYGSNDYWRVFHDPKNRQGLIGFRLPEATDPSTMDAWIPININL